MENMSIKEFNALLTNENGEQENTLLAALRALTEIKEPENVPLALDELGGWVWWN